jgi:hypothetical protein
MLVAEVANQVIMSVLDVSVIVRADAHHIHGTGRG